MSSFTRLLLEKGINISEAPGALPHRSRQSNAYPAAQVPPALSLDALLAQLDEEDASCVPEANVPKSRSRQELQESRPEKTNPRRPYYYDPRFSEASSAAHRRSEAFENIQNQSLREDAQTISRQKPRSAETRKPSHWNFSFNVNREVVGAELLEMGEDGELQPPAQDPKSLPRTGKGKAEPLPGLPGLRQGPLRTEPGLARFRPIPGHNEWVAGLQKLAEANRVKAIVDVMWKEEVPSGKAIIQQGDLQADYFYVVQSGSFQVSKTEAAASAEKVASAALGTIEAGGSFGELALLYFAPRAATITATADAVVFVTARQQFKELLMKANQRETEENMKHVSRCDCFAALKESEKKELAAAFLEMTFSKDELVFEQGERGTQFFLLVEGEVSVVKDGKEVSKIKATYFGERALQQDEPRAATIKVISPTAKTLWIDKESFEILIGSLEDLMKRGKDGTAAVKKATVAPKAGDSKRFGNIKFKDLKKLGLLGCGGFGAVEMVEDLKTNETYALKNLSKGYVVKSGMQSSVISEKNVQLMCDSPFVVKLYETFNSDQHLHLLLELALGGELYATYNKRNLWGQEKCAKFYVAGTVFAFEHLHGKKIIFRDLKPENLLLNDKGHVKLTDMGLAKVCPGKTYTTCGTPDYFAPELIASKGHNLAVDWWCLGILTFELCSGHPPFESATPMQIYSKVQKGIQKVVFPKKLKGNIEALVKGLCNATPSERLPMKKGGTQNIKNQAWFEGFGWDEMANFTLTPPYKPTVKSKKDAANFSANKEDMPPQIPYKDPKTGWDQDFATSS